ncbi:MAG: radical SAM protein [Theionarchaea archaeon]|nr:radical SAM protein [Theionarchaea archaeon]
MSSHSSSEKRVRSWKTDGLYPFILQFSITGVCNLRCSHCYDDADAHFHMSFDRCREVFNTFFTFCQRWNRAPIIWLTGGEPTIHPSFWDIIDHIQALSDTLNTPCQLAVLSNGISITPDWVERLETYRLFTGVQISVDGVEANIHDAVRGKGNFEKAVQALRILTASRLITHIHFVVHRDNFEDGFKITDFAREMGADVLTVTRLVPWGRGKELYEKMLSPQQVQSLYKKLSDDFDEILSQSSHSRPKPFISRERCDWPVIYPDPSDPDSQKKNGIRCGAARSYINVMETGDVYPCRRMPITIGNIFEQSLEDIWQHPLLWKLREKHIYMQGKCQQCYFCTDAPHICSGGASCIAYACYQDPFQPDPQCALHISEGE